MKPSTPIYVLLFLLASGGAVGAQETGILAFGDSITKGFGDVGISCADLSQGGYPPRLEQGLIQEGWQVKVRGSGVCGERTDDGVARLPGVLDMDQQSVVILMEATNDLVQGVGIETMLFNLDVMADAARARGVRPIYSSVPPIRLGSATEAASIFADQVRNLAAQQNVVFADPFSLAAVPDLFTLFYQDNFHPNADGYGLLAETFVGPVGTALDREGFLPLGHPHYCRDFGLCGHGQGDCDSDEDCETGATCVNDVGADFGYKPNIDVCIADNVVNCTLELGNPSYCTDCGPCSDGLGDCDNDTECLFGTTCVNNVGADFGLAPGTDMCLRDAPVTTPPLPCTLPAGHPDFCTQCGPCSEGQGDCDGDDECGGATFCANNVGADFGFAPSIDVCLSVEPGTCPVPNGHPHFCRECGPCEVGEGDCDGLDQCVAGAFCGQNNGADFGFSENIDVCVAQ